MKTFADIFLDEEIPAVERAFFAKAFGDGYLAVEQLLSETPLFNCPPARFAARGHLTAWAVDFALSGLIETGKWKVEGYEWAWFNKPTGKYLRIYTKRAVVTVSQVEDLSSQPRKADFRDNAAYDNQPALFLMPGEKTPEPGGRPHLLLLHGYQTLRFIHVGMPNKAKEPAWLGLSRNVLDEIQDISSDQMPSEGPITTPIPTIKEEIQKRARDNGR